MDLSVSKIRGARAFMALLTFTAGAGALHATTALTVSVSGPITCSLQTGPGPAATITVKTTAPVTSSTTVSFPASPGNGLSITPALGNNTLTAANTAANTGTGITYNVVATTGCGALAGNLTTAAVATSVQFTATGLTAGSVSVTDNVSSTYTLNAVVTGAVTCNTLTGPGTSATITVTPFLALSGASTIAVTYGTVGNGLVVTPPASTTLGNGTTSLAYTVSAPAGCVGTSSTSTGITFKNAGTADVIANVTDTVTVTPNQSPLVFAPSPVTIRCIYTPSGNSPASNSSNYAPAAAQTISITSAETGGTPFTVDTTGDANSVPNWLTVNTTSTAASAGPTATTFTVRASAGCDLGGQTTHTWNIHLVTGAPTPDLVIPVTLQNVYTTPLTVTPVPAATSITLSYIKGSGAISNANVSVTSTVPSVFVSIDTTTLPSWLTVDSISGTAPWSLRFSTTAAAASLAPGTYTASVGFQVSGYSEYFASVTLLVNNSAPKLSVNSTSVSIPWTIGAAIPTYTITATSSDSPIQYAITTGGTLAPILINTTTGTTTPNSGLAYSFGTEIPVTFTSSVFSTAQPGQVLTGTVTFTWGNPASTTVVTFLITVQSPGATITSISPSVLPTAAPGSQPVTLTLYGSGFVGGTNAALATRIGIVVNNQLVNDTNVQIASVPDSSNLIVSVTVPTTADSNLPFTAGTNGTPVVLGVINGPGNIPTSTASFTISAGPIIQGATSSSSFIEVTGMNPTFAPYDLITLWGSAFCSCTSSQILTGSPDAVTLRYPTSLPLPSSGTVSVGFYAHGTTTNPVAMAPLLFATSGQINLVVPGGLSAGTTYDIIVASGSASSAAFPVSIAVSDPGIFTIGSDGQGSGAVLDVNWNLITNSNPAGIRSGGSDSDTIQIFATGLGVPDSAANSLTNSLNNNCVTPAAYQTALQAESGVTLSSIDGAVIQVGLLNGSLAPCFNSTPVAVTVGGATANVTYAGFVADTVAGLYQIDATLPSTSTFNTAAGITLTQPVQVPIQVSIGGTPINSQSGVTIWVAPRLNVSASNLISGAVTAMVGTQVADLTTITAIEGTSPYTFSVTSGLLPSGLSLNASTGVISGRPQLGTAGNYVVTVTATDSAATPVTGSVTFTISVSGGLYLSNTTQASAVFGTAVGTLTTVSATGGKAPYTYNTTLAFSDNSGNMLVGSPTGMTINGTTGVISTTAATLAGTYNVTVTATDANGLTGALTFPLVIALKVTEAAGSNPDLYVITVGGSSGTPLYVISGAGATAGLQMSGNDVVQGGASGGPYNTTVTVTDSVTLAPGAAAEGVGSVTWSATP